ncbi:ArgE/DapE family deacylase [Halalkalibacterium halodurans]|jgi:acetylornithine deacetylase|uniref:Acetylornithine deacetylase n=3 Tax=Halalkalibacterium halodurans TaxID=86665 RepID=Q9KE02_HALH5|nr:ArgE/DapE family deacylase [Halalkalibacterium halodurans]MED4079262.1 ArgE/DapE family deacylase [Halalkalibacterium halodurans]MED4085333.1 ArgE/DapE family deacylase [Halalkalibacterium halodurans]MED4105369.1 ArgE/DapE family deacylase [Halalkalibacterium halodurans]MED4108220.1 ArgE/DapE family deacylase [Halalkalibacterium halodurans]MED4124095.1 ArgE/DapE family deacylase [Halalkalibacterium halodurans]
MEQLQKVMQTIDEQWEEQVAFLQTLGRFPSTLGNEGAIQAYLAHYFKHEMGLDVDEFVPNPSKLRRHPSYIDVDWGYDQRPIVVGTAQSSKPTVGKSLILQSHVDVVSPEPVEHWTYDPWGATIVENRMYGRGIQDMKSGLAAMIFAYRALQQVGVELGADVIFQSVIEEECTGNGALAALMRGHAADGALIPEPFGLQAVTTQVGVLWVRLKVIGAGAHTERADRAVNPIEKAYLLIKALQSYRQYLNQEKKHPAYSDHPHPLNVNIGTIHSGDWPSSVPTECTIDVRVGFYPGVDPDDVKSQIKDWINQASLQDEWLSHTPPELTFYGFSAPGAEISSEEPLVQALARTHKLVHGTKMKTTAITATTDIRTFINDFNIPATCYGPVGDGMHGIDEWVDLTSVKDVTKTYAAFMMNWCGVRK